MKRGRKARDEFFSVFAAPNALPFARLGLAVSRRVAPRAVERNRIKRRIREVFRHQQARLTGLDVVVVAQPAAAGAPRATLQGSLDQQWTRVLKQCGRS